MKLRRLLVERFEQRWVFACPFPEGKFSETLPLIVGENEIANYISLPAIKAPVTDEDSTPQTGLSVRFTGQGELAHALRSSGTLSSADVDSGNTFFYRNGESHQVQFDAVSLSDSLGAYRPLTQVDRPTFLKRELTISLYYEESHVHRQPSDFFCSAQRTYVAVRFISPAKPGTNEVPFGLTLADGRYAAAINTSEVGGIFNTPWLRMTMSDATGPFTIDRGTIFYKPPVGGVRMQRDEASLQIFSDLNGGEFLGALSLTGERYTPAKFYFDEPSFAQNMVEYFPGLQAASSQLIESLKHHSFPFGASQTFQRSDADIVIEFKATPSEVCGKTGISADTSLPWINLDAIDSLARAAAQFNSEYVRVRFSELIEEGLQDRSQVVSQIYLANIAAVRTDNTYNIEKALVHELGHALGFYGHISPKRIEPNKHNDVMRQGQISPDMTNVSFGFTETGSLPFLKTMTGQGRTAGGYYPSAAEQALALIRQEKLRPDSKDYHALIGGDLNPQPAIALYGEDGSVLPPSTFQTASQFGVPSVNTYRVCNVGSEQLWIQRIYATHRDDFEAIPENRTIFIPPGESYLIKVFMLTDSVGTKQGQLSIISNAVNNQFLTQSLSGEVVAINDSKPIARPDELVVWLNEPSEFDVTSNDVVKPDQINGLSIVFDLLPLHGSLQLSTDNKVLYRPASPGQLVDEFYYHLVDATGQRSESVRVGMRSVDRSNKPFYNLESPLDVNSDRRVTPIDALLIINELNVQGSSNPAPRVELDDWYYFDVNADNLITAIDALLVINSLNLNANGEGPCDQTPVVEDWSESELLKQRRTVFARTRP